MFMFQFLLGLVNPTRFVRDENLHEDLDENEDVLDYQYHPQYVYIVFHGEVDLEELFEPWTSIVQQ